MPLPAMTCLIQANWKDKEWDTVKGPVMVERGSFITSLKKLSQKRKLMKILQQRQGRLLHKRQDLEAVLGLLNRIAEQW